MNIINPILKPRIISIILKRSQIEGTKIQLRGAMRKFKSEWPTVILLPFYYACQNLRRWIEATNSETLFSDLLQLEGCIFRRSRLDVRVRMSIAAHQIQPSLSNQRQYVVSERCGWPQHLDRQPIKVSRP